jgi:serine/threonine protein kinase
MIKDLRADDPATVGPYRLLGRLGAGGMGEVYLAKSPGGRLVAIKLIRPELAEERGFRARFASEITAARNVSGIYTAAVVDADPDAELPWMATVYVAGPSLTDAVEESGPLPVASVLALAGGLAEALAAIHRVGLVHRDLKPSNVLLASDGPRVIDFGISLAVERSMLTATGMVMGSPGFMSPEQARGQREVGAPTDIFSLGAVLAYAATGDNPFGGGPTPALLYRVVNEVPDLAAVPARLSLLVGQCLEKNPADRPTPAEVLALLGDDVGVLNEEWLPPSVTQTMARYTPTRQTPLPQPPASQPTPARQQTPVPRQPSAWPAPVPQPAPVPPVAGVPGYAPTEQAPVAGRFGQAAPTFPAAVPATVQERGVLPETALVPLPGAFTSGDLGLPGGPGGRPPTRRSSPLRRWRWPITAVAVAAVVALVAVLLTSHSHKSPTVNSTASLAGNNGTAPATPAATAASSAKPTPTVTQSASQASTPATQAPATSAPASATSAAPTTATPTQTTTRNATPTASATATGTPTATASATQAPTATATATSSAGAAPTTAAPTAAATPSASASP